MRLFESLLNRIWRLGINTVWRRILVEVIAMEVLDSVVEAVQALDLKGLVMPIL